MGPDNEGMLASHAREISASASWSKHADSSCQTAGDAIGPAGISLPVLAMRVGAVLSLYAASFSYLAQDQW
jgi:hypothetical protein